MTTREKILTTAARLFQSKGYHATGLNEIISESGSPKGSLYYYFPEGKLQLAIEAVEYAGGVINGNVAARLGEKKGAAEAFRAVVSDVIEHFREDAPRFEDVSLSFIAFEATNETENLRRACQSVFDAREELFAAKLESCGYREAEARRLGSLMQLLLEGAITATRTRGDAAALKAVAEYIPTLLIR